MNTSELSLLIGKIKTDFKKQKLSKAEAKLQLQNINWDIVVEDTVSKSSLKSVATATIMLIDLPKEE